MIGGLSGPRSSSVALLLGFVSVMVGVGLFLGRNGIQGGTPPSQTYHALERGSIFVAAVLSALGFAGMARHLDGLGEGVLSLIAATGFAMAVVPLGLAEVAAVFRNESRYALIVTYVVTAFLAQAAVGFSILRTGYPSVWIGWVAIVGGLGLLTLLIASRPSDIYFPVLHHVVPLLIALAILLQGGSKSAA